MTSFLDLHRPGEPLLLPNPWDAGSARILAALGFHALATTSSGFALTLGRPDGAISRDEALGHATAIVEATELPVSADLENGFAHDPAGVAETVRRAIDAGLAGCSIEDATGDDTTPVYDIEQAADRIAAAAETAGHRMVITARAENHLYGRDDLADTIARLQRYQQAGAQVLYAPGLVEAGQLRSVVASLDRPVNALALPGGPSVAELAELGIARVSVGGALAFHAYGALVEAAQEFRDQGTYGFAQAARRQRGVVDSALRSR